ncbi:MAG: cyclophilin-like fold protein, partial [Treponema sp.]|nr:cyclophilin-like fold protein [Treponema sp.]
MKKLTVLLIMALSCNLTVCAQGGSGNTSTGGTMKIIIGNRELTATLVQNSSTEALKELLRAGPITINMRDYGNMEKVGSFG